MKRQTGRPSLTSSPAVSSPFTKRPTMDRQPRGHKSRISKVGIPANLKSQTPAVQWTPPGAFALIGENEVASRLTVILRSRNRSSVQPCLSTPVCLTHSNRPNRAWHSAVAARIVANQLQLLDGIRHRCRSHCCDSISIQRCCESLYCKKNQRIRGRYFALQSEIGSRRGDR